MCLPIHAIDCLKSWTINYMCTYSCNRLCEKLDYYSYGHVLVQLIVRRIRNMIVHMRILFITCVLDCMNSCTSDCLYEHPQYDPSSEGPWLMKLYTTPPSILSLVPWVPQNRQGKLHPSLRGCSAPPPFNRKALH